MSERRVDINLSDKSDAAVIAEVETKQELSREERKAKLVSILNRGHTADRQHVPLPDDMYGEWVPDDKMEIYRMESMGFRIDTEFAKRRALHQDSNTGDGSSKIADTVFMVAPREVKEIIDEIRLDLFNQANAPRKGRQKEERDFEAETQAVNLPSQIKSRTDSVTADEIRATLTAKD